MQKLSKSMDTISTSYKGKRIDILFGWVCFPLYGFVTPQVRVADSTYYRVYYFSKDNNCLITDDNVSIEFSTRLERQATKPSGRMSMAPPIGIW